MQTMITENNNRPQSMSDSSYITAHQHMGRLD